MTAAIGFICEAGFAFSITMESFWLGVRIFKPLNVTKFAVRQGTHFQANVHICVCVCVCITPYIFSALPTALARFVKRISTKYLIDVMGIFYELMWSHVVPLSQGLAKIFCIGPENK
jgi:hypothetical protein